MSFKKWLLTAAATLFITTTIHTYSTASAEEARTIENESIYDLLVDRYFNGSGFNDTNVNAKDPSMFAGGDFNGLIKKKDYIKGMGFTSISIGAIFDTEKYDGSLLTSYEAIEPNFGTEEELKQLVQLFNADEMNVIADFPLNNVSAMHEWATNEQFIATKNEETIQWNFNNEQLREQLIEAALKFVETYELNGIRLTNIDAIETQYVNEFITDLKEANPSLYILTNEESDADFDLYFSKDTNEVYRNAFATVDRSTARIEEDIEKSLRGPKLQQIYLDNLQSNRFIVDVLAADGYPPTRAKLAVTATLLLPGVPVTAYGTEIAMNGEAGQEAHQYYNFKTDTELSDYIGQLHELRNSSDTLRAGDFKLLKNEDGFLIFERKSAEETWLVFINNTSKTKAFTISKDEFGEGKEIRGMFHSEIVREDKNGDFTLVLDREMAEVYQVIDERGFNLSYMIALALVVVIYAVFMFAVIKRGKKRNVQ